MNLEKLGGPTRIFAEKVLAAFPDWTRALEVPGEGDAPGDCSFTIASPAHHNHKLSVVTRGNSVEVRYDDGDPPGPAETLFVDLDKEPESVAESVSKFVSDVIAGRVVVVREPLGIFTRWFRRDCRSLAWFRSAEDVQRAAANRYSAVYSWRPVSG